jgi:hypothetical protein
MRENGEESEGETRKIEGLKEKIRELTGELNEYKRARLLSFNPDAQVWARLCGAW